MEGEGEEKGEEREGGGRGEGGEGESDVVSGRERKKYGNNRNEEGMEGGRYRIWTKTEAGRERGREEGIGYGQRGKQEEREGGRKV